MHSCSPPLRQRMGTRFCRRLCSLGGRRFLGNTSLQFGRREAATFRDDAGDQIGRRHVEGRIPAGDAGRRDAMLTDVRHLAIRSLFDDNVIAARDGQIDGRQRGGHIERNAVVAGNACDLVGADFVGRIAVGGHLNARMHSKTCVGLTIGVGMCAGLCTLTRSAPTTMAAIFRWRSKAATMLSSTSVAGNLSWTNS